MSNAMLDEGLVGAVSSGVGAITYSPRAQKPSPGQIDPPVPGTVGFRNVRGRSGDLIVVQLRGAQHETPKRRAALRTVGLHGIRSAVLRSSNDSTFWGSVRKVRDLIAIIELPDVVYGWDAHNVSKDDNKIESDSFPYGSSSRPAHLWRSGDGDYFGYEFQGGRLFGYWSTSLSFSDVSEGFDQFGLIPATEESYLAMRGADGIEHFRGSWDSVLLNAASGAIPSLASIAVENSACLIWKEPHARFYDSDSVRAELGLVTSPPDAFLTRQLVRVTANLALIDSAKCEIRFRSEGRLREVPI